MSPLSAIATIGSIPNSSVSAPVSRSRVLGPPLDRPGVRLEKKPAADKDAPVTPDGLGRWLPGLTLLRRQRGEGLRADITAGVVLAALLVPQGMAYGELAGVSPVAGLYATMVPLVVYFLLGPSRILVLGPDWRLHRSSPLRSSRSRRATGASGSRWRGCWRSWSARSCSPAG